MIPNKKTRAYICFIPALFFFFFLMTKQLEFIKTLDINQYFAFILSLPLSAFCYFCFWLGLVISINKTLEYFGYED